MERWLRAQATRQQRHNRLARLLLTNLHRLVTPGDTHELRVPRRFTKAYHYDQLPELATQAAQLDGVENVYFTLNPVQPDLTTNATNASTVVRRYLYVDVDPDRLDCDSEREQLTSDWCSTDAEKATAYTMMAESL
jgi:hypothetical protein